MQRPALPAPTRGLTPTGNPRNVAILLLFEGRAVRALAAVAALLAVFISAGETGARSEIGHAIGLENNFRAILHDMRVAENVEVVGTRREVEILTVNGEVFHQIVPDRTVSYVGSFFRTQIGCLIGRLDLPQDCFPPIRDFERYMDAHDIGTEMQRGCCAGIFPFESVARHRFAVSKIEYFWPGEARLDDKRTLRVLAVEHLLDGNS